MTFGGTILGTTSNDFIQSAIDWYYDTNTENNSTTVTARLYYRRTNTGYVTGGTGTFTITINGTTTTKNGVSLNISTGWVEAMSASVIVPHNADGSKSVAISATGSLPPSTLTATYCSGTVTLPTIPRASTISCTTTDIESNPTITITRASSNFTHTIKYRFGTLSGTIAEKTSATSITSWTIPASFYAEFPDAKRGVGALTCDTYSGNNLIGTTACSIWVTTDETKCKPTVSGNVVDTNPKTVALTGNAEKYLVRFYSTASCTMSATLNKNAGSFLVKTINNIPVSGTTLDIENVEVGTFDFYAKDSREYFNSDKVTRTLIPYIKLTNDATIYRDDPTSGNATLEIDGNYFNGSFGAVHNTLTVEYRLEGEDEYTPITPTISGNEYHATVSLSGLDYTKAFNFEVVVKDKLSTVSKPLTIQKGIPVFDWGENDFNFNVPISINGIPVVNYVVEQGTDGIWKYRKWSDGTAECWGIYVLENVAVENSWGELSESEGYVVGLPSNLFIETPQFNITLVSNLGVMLQVFSEGSATNTPYLAAARPYGGTIGKLSTSIAAFGRWK